MGCADADTLAALVANALADSERAGIAIHAASCERCHALLEGLLDSRAYDETVDSTKRTGTVDVRPGTSIGRYVIGEQMGAGGMGVVFAAVDTELQRRVAVKLLRPDGHGQLGTQGRERLMREARMLARLSHPNVVTVFDVGTHGDSLFIAMELVEGGSLSAWLRRAPRTTNEIVDRLIEAGRGLAAAHDAGVVHRDVKPDNVLVGRDGRARMTDFGLARADESAAANDAPSSPPLLSPELTRTGTLMGTPVYMAPEQMKLGDTEPRTDQWSFCAMLYEALAGVRPFSVEDFGERSAQIAEGRLAPAAPGRRVPTWVRRIVQRGLRADPAERWPSMDAVVAALERGRHRGARIARWSVLGAAIAVAGVAGAFALAPAVTPTSSSPASPYVLHDPPRWTDRREGCHCPFSACNGRCLGECNARDFVVGKPLLGVNIIGRQNAIEGASLDGDTLLYLSGKRCSLDRLMLARRHGDVYAPIDLTDQLDRTRVKIFEGCCTLAPDGQSIIIATADERGFVRMRVGGNRIVAYDAEEFAQLVGAATGLSVRHPVLGADQRTLIYKLVDRTGPTGDVGPLDGPYESVRADVKAPFPRGRRLVGRARQYDYPTGISSDGLTLFMAAEFATRVMMRATTDEQFAGPNPEVLPPLLPGWRAIPVQHCKRIFTTATPGGCAAEVIFSLEARD